jgi:hypothetical protein
VPLADGKDYHVFLSHCWADDEEKRNNHERVEKVKEALQKRGVKTWIDTEDMRRNIRTCMSRGLEASMSIIFFLTKKYQEKINGGDNTDDCFFEFNAASANKILANNRYVVVMEKYMLEKGLWTGLLNAELCKDLFFNMSDDDLIEDECDTIVKWMEEKGTK